MHTSRFACCLFILLTLLTAIAAEAGTGRKRVKPPLYGHVLMSASAQPGKVPAVGFEHWNHRNRFTCRLCHVDLGFAMTAGSTRITAAENERGRYCGACHNGVRRFDDRPLFAACRSDGRADAPPCIPCHSNGPSAADEEKFYRFAETLPKERLGNGIDWEKAEEQGKIHLLDSLDGISVKRSPLKVRDDFDLTARLDGMPEIRFSHKKHTTWSGCELCHPEIFLGVKKGTERYSMVDLFAGRYCGSCHDKVAFPQNDCQRCHTQPVTGS